MSISKYKLALVVLLPVLGLVTAYAVKRHQLANRGELWEAWLFQRERVVDGKWEQAADGMSDAFLGSGARWMYADSPVVLAEDAAKTAKLHAGQWMSGQRVICQKSEQRHWLDFHQGTLVLDVIGEGKGGRLVRYRDEIGFVVEDGRWRISRTKTVFPREDEGQEPHCESPVINFFKRTPAPEATAASGAGAGTPQVPTGQIGMTRPEVEASLGASLSPARAGFYEHNVISSGHPAKRIYQFSEGKLVRLLDVFVPPSCAHVVANAAGCRSAANVVIFRDAVSSARSQFGEPEAVPKCVETEQSLTALVEGQGDVLVQCAWRVGTVSVRAIMRGGHAGSSAGAEGTELSVAMEVLSDLRGQ